WASVISTVPERWWSPEHLARLVARSGDEDTLTGAVKRLAFARDAAIREAVLDELRGGGIDALTAVGSIDDLPDDVVTSLASVLGAALQSRAAELRGGVITAPGPIDPGRVLTLINVSHPRHGDWAPIIEVLKDRASTGDNLVEVLKVLEWQADKIDETAKAALIPIVESLIEPRPRPFRPLPDADPRAAAVGALHALAADRATPASLLAAGTDSRSRRSLIDSIARRGNPNDITALAMLASDVDSLVRAGAAKALANWMSRDIASALSADTLNRLLDDPGTQVARAAISEWTATVTDQVRPIAEKLVSHRSAKVRHDARRILASSLPSS
ncbi:MAG: HEAT repeat domain-containing protein, partial [Dermatophilaceae bacterium]